MRMIRCDRCGRDIAMDGSEKIGYVALNWRDVRSDDLLPGNPFEQMDFCEGCMEEITAFVTKRPARIVSSETPCGPLECGQAEIVAEYPDKSTTTPEEKMDLSCPVSAKKVKKGRQYRNVTWTDEENAKLIEMYRQGMSCGAIGEKLYVSHTGISSQLGRLKAAMTDEKREALQAEHDARSKRSIDRGKIWALHDAGWTIGKIATEMGFAWNTVRGVLDKERLT